MEGLALGDTLQIRPPSWGWDGFFENVKLHNWGTHLLAENTSHLGDLPSPQGLETRPTGIVKAVYRNSTFNSRDYNLRLFPKDLRINPKSAKRPHTLSDIEAW